MVACVLLFFAPIITRKGKEKKVKHITQNFSRYNLIIVLSLEKISFFYFFLKQQIRDPRALAPVDGLFVRGRLQILYTFGFSLLLLLQLSIRRFAPI